MTAQMHEVLIIDGEKTTMAFCPEIPTWLPEVRVLDPNELEADDSNALFSSTACWRGYQGTWEIRDQRLYLVDVRGQYRLIEQTPLLADWFTGVLRITRGRVLHRIHMGFGSVYEEETHIKVVDGVVEATMLIDNRQSNHNPSQLSDDNLPGNENRFPGDDAM